MRIVGGIHKGRPIKTPSGRNTRPTSDRTREAIFNILAHADWAPALEGARVMDVFAGSGALGFEALSRGAAACLFIETDHGARGAIRANIEAMGLFGNTRLHRRSALDLGPKPAGVGSPYTHAFLDPPYGRSMVPQALDGLAGGGWLAADAIAIAETGNDEDLAADGWSILDTRTYGAAKIWFLTRAPD
ncbi:MAG: 16S rRNA (guanine(966)-N(2))-methyltransferase RsmD [Pseudomonadota bacterium]